MLRANMTVFSPAIKKNHGNYLKMADWLFFCQGKKILYSGKRRLQSRWRVVFAQKGGSCLASQSGSCKESDKTTSAWQIIERQAEMDGTFCQRIFGKFIDLQRNHFIISFDWFGLRLEIAELSDFEKAVENSSAWQSCKHVFFRHARKWSLRLCVDEGWKRD